MGISLLAKTLRETVDRAPEGEIVVSIHLFGIRHEPELRDVSLRDLVDAAHIHRSYATEIRKGMRLAEHVQER
jgi:hypothetical protein